MIMTSGMFFLVVDLLLVIRADYALGMCLWSHHRMVPSCKILRVNATALMEMESASRACGPE